MKATTLATASSVIAIFISSAYASSAYAQTYQPIGPQTDVAVATVTGGGWDQCYQDLYSNSGVPLQDIFDGCPGERLMLACRETGSDTLALLAQAERGDALFDTDFSDTPHDANGTGWYFSDDWSWGFAAEGDEIFRISCDVEESGNNGQRLCWHTFFGELAAGFRCGSAMSLNTSADWERLIFVPGDEPSVPELECAGFEAPLDKLVTARLPNRVLPFKMQVLDGDGLPLGDADIAAPVLQLDFDSEVIGGPDGEELSSAGRGDPGNQFAYNPDDGTWQFNLSLKGFAVGSYVATAVSAESELYTLGGCVGLFEILGRGNKL